MTRDQVKVRQRVAAKGQVGTVRVRGGHIALVECGDGKLRAYFYHELTPA